MKNAFNECDRSAFFIRVSEDFPEISAWVKWCYSHGSDSSLALLKVDMKNAFKSYWNGSFLD